MNSGTFTPDQLSAILQDHIKTVVGHYAGQVYAWDVVNEAFEPDGSLRKTIWSRDGTGYIEQALRWAHAADPKALLFYNDFNAEDGQQEVGCDFQNGAGLQSPRRSAGRHRAADARRV